ncbi:pyridoxamine 5'-phosphate oxidase [Kordiimonas laminariae]|uniref:pyridoxamine 5'-phosphate oxidase n=1 Tax=Kordiimonas laminariae TaxID=2917717 RepID=UPI001FF34BB0|nr:pyridoxamine 5'-phosphate oxidase [Kordiimonas laminariae]MCK0069729.1 pyridoxamine 5'-phosphate oxidase [Kordiimonas laminariae]
MTQKMVAFGKPFETLAEWLSEAEKKELNDPTAMALATVNERGMPSVRMVLLKGADENGLVFYTNLESRKGQELRANPNAALLFHWKSLRRQIRVEGAVEPVTPEEADIYFASRARASRIGAWASKQSSEMEGRFEFEAAIAKYTAKFGAGDIPRPEFWSGFRLKPKYFEFWNDKMFRLHERKTYTLNDDEKGWEQGEIYP